MTQNTEPGFFTTTAGTTYLNFEEVNYQTRPGFKRVVMLLGDENDPNTPRAIWAQDPPGVVWDRQACPCDLVVVYLQGGQTIDGTWYGAGEARLQKGGTIYGPIESGPEGSTVLLVFKNDNYHAVFEGAAFGKFESPYYKHAHLPEEPEA
jgi:hypothetical protein